MSLDFDEPGIKGSAIFAFIITLAASILSLTELISQFTNYNYRAAQQKLKYTLLAPIIIGWPAWFTLLGGEDYVLLELIEDVYKSGYLLIFIVYIQRIIGWENLNSEFHFSSGRMESSLLRLNNASHLSKCCGEISLRTHEEVNNFLQRIRIGVFQFSIMLVVIVIISLILSFALDDFFRYGDADPTYGYFWVNVIRMISAAIAIYHLNLLRINVLRLKELKPIRLSSKVNAVIFAILLPEFQDFVISIIVKLGLVADTDDYDVGDQTIFLGKMLICWQMFILAIYQNVIFSADDYKEWPGPIEIKVPTESQTQLTVMQRSIDPKIFD